MSERGPRRHISSSSTPHLEEVMTPRSQDRPWLQRWSIRRPSSAARRQ
jgi:hypothetical protein